MKRFSQTLTVVVEAETAAMAATTVNTMLGHLSTLTYNPVLVSVTATDDEMTELEWEPGAPLQTLAEQDPQITAHANSPTEYASDDAVAGENAAIDPSRPENDTAPVGEPGAVAPVPESVDAHEEVTSETTE